MLILKRSLSVILVESLKELLKKHLHETLGIPETPGGISDGTHGLITVETTVQILEELHKEFLGNS